MKKILSAMCFLFTGCSVVLVYSPKAVCVHGESNKVEITGSDLRDNKLDQKSDGQVVIPAIP
jgi:hypothetical protein